MDMPREHWDMTPERDIAGPARHLLASVNVAYHA
jgi:hypothetical protein